MDKPKKKKKKSKFNKDFIEKYVGDCNRGYFLEVDVEYPKELFNFHKDSPFLPERKKVEKVEKLICSIEDKEKYIIHKRALKQALNHGLKLKTLHRIIQFQQKSMVKVIYWHEYWIKKKSPKGIWKRFF